MSELSTQLKNRIRDDFELKIIAECEWEAKERGCEYPSDFISMDMSIEDAVLTRMLSNLFGRVENE